MLAITNYRLEEIRDLTSDIVNARLLCGSHKSQSRSIGGVTISSEETTLELAITVTHVVGDKYEHRVAGPLAIGSSKVIGIVKHHADRVRGTVD